MLKGNLFCTCIMAISFLAGFITSGYAQKVQNATHVQSLLINKNYADVPHSFSPLRKKGERGLYSEALPVTTISGREVANMQYSNRTVTEVIQSLPNEHVDISRQSTIDLRGLGMARTLVLMDGKRRVPVYGQSVIYDLDNVPFSAVERVEVLKGGASAVYGSDAVSGVVNFLTRQEMQPRIVSGNVYDSYYDYPTFDFSGLQNNEYNNWVNNVKTSFTTKPGVTTMADDTYGKGGTLVIDLKELDDFRVQSMQFRDKGGNVRQWINYEIYPENYRFGETFYYDCSGATMHYSSGFTDKNGYEYSLTERAYQNNQPVAEYRDVWPANNGDRLRLNLWPQQTSNDLFKEYSSKYNFEIPKEQCGTNNNTACDRNILFGGFSMVFEDFGSGQERLKMPGGFINYTRMFSQNLGATAHLGYNSGERSMIDYSKLSFYAGVSYSPFERANCDDKFIFNTQALLGIVRQQQKFGNFEFKDSYFSGMFGFTQAFRVAENIHVRATEHYTPTFADGNTSHNFTLGLGVRFQF